MKVQINANGYLITMSTETNNLDVVELNVGGVTYATTLGTLQQAEPESPLAIISTLNAAEIRTIFGRDSKNRIFIDRDGVLFRYVLDYLRNKKLSLPENFAELERLRTEAEYYRLDSMSRLLAQSRPNSSSNGKYLNENMMNVTAGATSSMHQITPSIGSNPGPRSNSGYIVVGYRGTFAFGRDGLADVKFRKISRILVCGRVHLCREVFGETLNESRDPDHGQTDRYTSRFFLKHTFLEQAFDMLGEASFLMAGCAASGCSSSTSEMGKQTDSEENRWLHYNEFIFYRS
ncbi:unnamed protein product [Rotaria magnacalcarata]|uniref:BTB/POZ domain-containing protein KCTD16 n=2 Tax=Rotaria magnacalcarata TaxID=392030 RepID=A0A816ZXK0_9BILA|nr:unnamed protein product [Rotaria magnacalcarata]CAF2143564.1 unnamed protein product [Rotaria magnacalcarata]CAF2230584.1 unnamed protein product [Rotaria magnacalcarata]CAF3880145.1 unnamed protein product [Rotaria magnacalcarata]CAF3929915.1 unnamed protein product [Rotaria magnacalcarata]